MSEYYSTSGNPATSASLSSSAMRAEFALIEAGTDKLPTLSGNGNKPVVINSAGTSLTQVTAATFLATNLGLTATGTELDYMSGVTSAVQTQLDAKMTGSNNLSDVTVAATARTNLGVAIGSDVQAYSTHLDAVAALAKTDGNFIVANGTTFVAESGATARTSLGLGSLATASTINNSNWSGTDLEVANGGTGSSTASGARTALGVAIGSDVQAYSSHLAAIDALLKTDGNFIVANGTTFIAESGATARTSLGLGSIATQASSSVSITGGSIAGITDLAVADGGTGSSTAAGARTNLGLGSAAVANLLDEDSFTSNSASDAASQQSIKAYVDAAVSAGVGDADYGDITVSSSGTVWTIDSNVISTFGRTLTDDLDAATARTTLGLGTLATQSGTFSGTHSGTSSGTNTGDQTSVSGNAGTVTVSDAGGDTTCWVLVGTSQTGNQAPRTDAGFTFNATTNTLTVDTVVANLSGNATNVTGTVAVANGGTGATTASGARSNLGLGSLATASTINNSNWSGTDLAVANGGTGVSSLSSLQLGDFAVTISTSSPSGGSDGDFWFEREA